MPLNSAMHGYAALCSAIQCYAVLCSTMQRYAALFCAVWIYEKVLKQIEHLQCWKQEKWTEMIQDGAIIVQKYGKQISFSTHI